MKIADKLITNLLKIMKVAGFYVTAPGDPSVGIFPANWKIDGDFYFDNEEELEEFRKELNEVFTNYCGEGVHVYTFEEDAARTE